MTRGRGGGQICAGVGSLVCLCMFRPAPWLQSSFTDLQCCWHPQWWYWLSGGSSLFFVSILSLHSKTKTNRFLCVCVRAPFLKMTQKLWWSSCSLDLSTARQNLWLSPSLTLSLFRPVMAAAVQLRCAQAACSPSVCGFSGKKAIESIQFESWNRSGGRAREKTDLPDWFYSFYKMAEFIHSAEVLSAEIGAISCCYWCFIAIS